MSKCLPWKRLVGCLLHSARLPLTSKRYKKWCVNLEVGWLRPLGLCIALLFFKQSPQWRHRRDNPAVSQILIGNEPLMGASIEILPYRQPCFNQRKEFGKGTGEDLKKGGVLGHVQYYWKLQKHVYLYFMSTAMYSSETIPEFSSWTTTLAQLNIMPYIF